MRDPALPELEALRGVAITAVVGLHVSIGFLLAAPAGGSAASWALVAHLLFVYGTPLFVALSMAGLSLGYARPMAFGADYAAFLGHRARRVLPAYVFWTLITLVRDDPGSFRSPVVIAGHLALGSASFHFYFVPLICEYYVLWPFFATLASAARTSARAAFGIGAMGIACMLLVWRAASAGLVSNGILVLPLFWFGYATLGVAAAPFVVEKLTTAIRTRPPWFPWSVLAVATAGALVLHVRRVIGPTPSKTAIVMGTTIFQPPMMVYTLAVMALAVVLVGGPARGTRLLQALGRSSYGIYLAHVLVLGVVLRRIFGRPDDADYSSPVWMVTMLTEWVVCLALTWALVQAMEHVPGLRPFAGRSADRALTPRSTAP
jgi:peptidoglycan/LPS O-acetylase OafA/YrhL